MLKFWFSKYELLPMNPIGAVLNYNFEKRAELNKEKKVEEKAHYGALLKIQWPNGNEGFSDLHPWPELGDHDLETHLVALANGKISQLVEQAIWLAKKDASLRKSGKNAFVGAAKVKNHYLISDYITFTDSTMRDLRSSGFTTIKIKVGRNIEEEAEFIKRMIKQNPVGIRLDFNAKIDFDKYEKFISYFALAEKARIEFIEDPIKWDLKAWTEARKLGVPLAVDFEIDKVDWEKLEAPLPFKVVIIKPTRQDVEKTVKLVNRFALKMVITSALDHPVGVAQALMVASELKKFYPNTLLECGCLTLRIYKPNEFSTRIQVQGPYLNAIAGTGIGFNDLLQKLDWQPVKK